jgi:hypothetical protein
MKKDNTILYLGAGALLLGYFGFFKPILNALNITQSAASQEAANNIKTAETGASNTNPFNPNYWKKNGAKILTQATIDNYCAKIYNAMGNFGDDEEVIYGVFKALSYKTQVSYLAYKFNLKYKVDLFEFLKRGKNNWNYASGLNDTELNNIIKIVNGLK